jgi:uncharacterized integral membrane protein
MRLLATLAKVAVFLFFVGFAIPNLELVTLRYYLGMEWQLPLVVIILGFFMTGAVLGVLSCLGIIFRQRRRLTRLEPAPAAPPPAQPALPAEAAVDTPPARRS